MLHGEFADGLFPDWPWFLDDQRPQGFLGRAFARRGGAALGAPEDLRLWRDEDIAAESGMMRLYISQTNAM